MAYYRKQLDQNPKTRKAFEERFSKALGVVRTQMKNGIGFTQDKELRFFQGEFNDRIWQYGLGSLPSSFNVLEGFFKWIPELFYFELLEEEEHLFSLYDFSDFATSNACSNSLDYFIENVEDDLIYSYNILNDVRELTFSTTDSKEYVIGGVSFVKRGHEAFMMIIAGEIGSTKEFTKSISSRKPGRKLKSYLTPAPDRREEAVGLFGRNDIWKVNVYVRIDLERRTIDSRYIQKDTGIGFSTITDDYGMMEASIKDQTHLNNLIKSQSEAIATYDPIFEAAYHCLFLPEYFDHYNDDTLPEEHPTGLYKETLRKPTFKDQVRFSANHFVKQRDVWVLDRNIIPVNGNTALRPTELQIEKSGYWKLLDPGKSGTDKVGREIHGRTWVEQTLSWYESGTAEKPIEVSVSGMVSRNRGYIYLLRNPAHELDIFKIGLTTKLVEERAKQLSGTPSPDQFMIINRWHVQDCVLAEKLIHAKLEAYRLNPKREFFKIRLEDAIKEIIPIIEEINSKPSQALSDK